MHQRMSLSLPRRNLSVAPRGFVVDGRSLSVAPRRLSVAPRAINHGVFECVVSELNVQSGNAVPQNDKNSA
jgi:hypothetical protein